MTLDYFRHNDESSDDDSDDEGSEERGDFVAGGIYAPAAQSISAAAAGLTLSIAAAAGIKRLVNGQTDHSTNQTNNANTTNTPTNQNN